jgi:Ser/Thr protein kinase RdoA (MazF antagonist)
MLSLLGQSLGRLHRLSSEYSTDGERRRNHLQVLEWISQTLAEVGRQDEACAEAAALRAFFSRLPAGRKVYGLVHYDFETDNVFLDESTSALGVIDFDDAMYHWYVMDIEQTLDSLAEHIEKKDPSAWKDAFLAGYRLEFGIDGDLIQMLPGFRRFADLYTYARVLRSIQEKWENEPQWMQGLRRKLEAVLEARSANFGLPLPE